MRRLDIGDKVVRLRDEEKLSYGKIGKRAGKDKGQLVMFTMSLRKDDG